MRYAGAARLFGVMVTLSLCLLGGCGAGSTASSASDPGTATAATASVLVDPANGRQISRGDSTTFNAIALDANGAPIVGRTVQWSLSSPTVASIANASANPVTLIGQTAGATQVTATVDGKSGSASLTVGAPQIVLNGRVVDAQSGQGIAGAQVDASSAGPFPLVDTAADGSYSLTLPGTASSILLYATKSGYVRTSLVASNLSATNASLETMLMVRSTGASGTVSGTVRNARNNAAIVGAAIDLRQGQGSNGLGFVAETTSDAQGHYAFATVAEGTYTVSVRATGFSDCSHTAISIGAGTAALAQDLSCSPASSTDLRIVLTWGSAPSDLDAHLTGPNATGSDRFHVYYATRGSASAAPFADLDVDKTTGFGPETVTITQLASGVYRFSVHDYTDRNLSSSAALGGSGAKVELYLPGAPTPQTFFVPNQPGTLWTVFELAATSGVPVVTPRNTMGYASSSGDVP